MADRYNPYWNKERIDWLRDHQQHISRKELCDLYNKTFGTHITKTAIAVQCTRHGLINDFDGRYVKGQVSPFKGLKQTEFMSKEAIERTKATRFKKGDHSHKEGELFTKLNKGVLRQYIRHDGKNILYERFVWEMNTGDKLTHKDYIIHLDNNHLNCEFTNLLKISNADHLHIVSPSCGKGYKTNPDLNRAYIYMNQLERKIKC